MAIASANATSQYRASIGHPPSPLHGLHQYRTTSSGNNSSSSAAATLATTAAAAAIGPAGTTAQLTQHLHHQVRRAAAATTAATTTTTAAAMTRESSISSHASGTLLRHNEYFRSNQSLCSCNNAVELENNQFLTDVDLLPVPPPPILSLNRKQLQSSSALSAKTSASATTATTTTPKHMTNHHHYNINNNNNNKHITTTSSTTSSINTTSTTTTNTNTSMIQTVALQHPASTYHKKSATCNSSALNCATKCVFESNIRGTAGGGVRSATTTLLNSCTNGGGSGGGCDAASINSTSTTCGHHIGNCLPNNHRATSSTSTATAGAASKSSGTSHPQTPHSLQRSNSSRMNSRSKFDLIACGLDDADACATNDDNDDGDTDLESMYVYHNGGGSLMHTTAAPFDKTPDRSSGSGNKYSTIGPTTDLGCLQQQQQRFARNQPLHANKPYAKTPPLLRQQQQQHTLPNCTGSKYELTRLLSLSASRRDVACSGDGLFGQPHPCYTCSNSNHHHSQHLQHHHHHQNQNHHRYTPYTACSAPAASDTHSHHHSNKSHSLNSLLCDDLLQSMPCSNSLIDLDYPLSAATNNHHHPHQQQHHHPQNNHHHHQSEQHNNSAHQTATTTTTAAITPPPPPPPQLSAQHHHHHFACSMAGGGGGSTIDASSSYPYVQFDTGTGLYDDHHHHHHMSGAAPSSGLLDLTNQMAMCDDSFYGSKLWLDLNGIGGIGGDSGKHNHQHLHHSSSSHRHPAAADATAGGGALGQHHVHMYGGSEQQQRQQQSNNSIPWRHRQCPSVGSSNSSATIARWNPTKHWLAVTSILLIVGAVGVAVPLALRVADGASFEERLHVANQLLDAVPLIDGHNDLPWNIRKFLHNQINDFNFDVNLTTVLPWSRSNWSHTDLYRLKKGKVSAQFWAAYVPCDAQHKDAVQLTLEQIDVIIRLTDKYRPKLTMCNSAFDIMEAHKNQQLCSFAGVEGGHSIGGSLSVLRMFYALGVRYMTLTSTCHTTWADSSSADAPKFDTKHGGLTEHGKTIVREMNRIGMIVDLSHVSVMTMRDTLATSEAPVIFSHSSAYALCNSSRNVQDDILRLVAKNGGLVMINLYSMFLTCSENASVHDVVAHINHIREVAGVEHVGIGAGFDGINHTPVGLEDVSTYPVLFSELLGGGWTADDLTKLAGQNFIRVLAEVEALRDKKKSAGLRPYEDVLSLRTEDPFNCTSS